jgi:hypothetical protein
MADKKRDILEFVEQSNFEQFTPTRLTRRVFCSSVGKNLNLNFHQPLKGFLMNECQSTKLYLFTS